MPYRTTRSHAPKATADPGVIDDMVKQFADRYAFLRELVQNGIDAGATRLTVRVARDPDGVVRTAVDDNGSGMTRAIIEGPLLTLFSSSKESDKTKIGKYGIGFVSVFALEPERVEVETRRGDESWLVRLFGDHSYELLEGTPAGNGRADSGTTVTVVQSLELDAYATHASSVSAALRRWCRHARVPITLVVADGYASEDVATINIPLAVPGLVSVSVTEGDEHFVVAVGDAGADAAPPEAAPSFAGFYNRGLTLMETVEAGHGVRFKVDSPRLSHTLSRDNVRRDHELRRVTARLDALVGGPLAAKLHERLAEAATEAVAGPVAPYAALFEAALATAFVTVGALEPAKRARVPLVEAIGRKRTMPLREVHQASSGRVLVAGASDPITRALARRGEPVVRHVELGPLITRVFGDDSVRETHRAFAYAEAVTETHPEDQALIDACLVMLRAADRKIGRVRLAAFHGLLRSERCRVARVDADDALSKTPKAAATRAWGASSTLFLNVDDAVVRLARRRARTAPGVAAHLLCRAILLNEGPLAPKQVDRLLEAAAEARHHE